MRKLLPPDAFPDEMQRVVYQKMVPAAYRGDAMSFALDALPLSSIFGFSNIFLATINMAPVGHFLDSGGVLFDIFHFDK